MASIVCELYDQKIIEAKALPQTETFRAALQFLRAEGIVPAPEPSHAVAAAIQEALAAKAAGEKRVILFNLCGHGHFDMSAYEVFMAGRLEDYDHPEHEIEQALAGLPQI
jgi:tryptophan synthase beta chain